MKIALIIGHGNGDSGAMGFNGMSEFNYNSFVAEEVAKSLKQVELFYRGDEGIAGVGHLVEAFQPDISIELHLNAFNGKSEGCEVLCLVSDGKAAELGRNFAEAFCKKFRRRVRADFGVKWIDKKDRGYFNLHSVESVPKNILVEPFFVDNQNEWIEPNDYINFLIKWIGAL